MFDLPPILVATLAGFFSGLLFSSIPVGPINLTILNEGSRRGFLWAMLIGLGANGKSVLLAVLEALCEEHDFQIWMAKVDSSGTVGIVMEDGVGTQMEA